MVILERRYGPRRPRDDDEYIHERVRSVIIYVQNELLRQKTKHSETFCIGSLHGTIVHSLFGVKMQHIYTVLVSKSRFYLRSP